MEARERVLTMRVTAHMDEWLEQRSQQAARTKSGFIYWVLMQEMSRDQQEAEHETV